METGTYDDLLERDGVLAELVVSCFMVNADHL